VRSRGSPGRLPALAPRQNLMPARSDDEALAHLFQVPAMYAVPGQTRFIWPGEQSSVSRLVWRQVSRGSQPRTRLIVPRQVFRSTSDYVRQSSQAGRQSCAPVAVHMPQKPVHHFPTWYGKRAYRFSQCPHRTACATRAVHVSQSEMQCSVPSAYCMSLTGFSRFRLTSLLPSSRFITE
jgi:hypothetical protein